MPSRNTDIEGDQTEDRIEKAVNTGSRAVDVTELSPSDRGATSRDRSGAERTNRFERRQVLQGVSAAGVVGIAGCLGSGDEGGHMGESGAEFTFLDETYTASGGSIECRQFGDFGYHMAAADFGDGSTAGVDGSIAVTVRDDSVVVSVSVSADGQYTGDGAHEEIDFDIESDEKYTAGTVHLEPDEAAQQANPNGGDVEFNISC